MEHYVFATEAEAIAAESDVATLGNAPIVGVNAKTGQPEPSKQLTVRWAIPWSRATDGKYVFPRPPQAMREMITPEQAAAFEATHDFQIEIFDSSWVPTEFT